MEENDISYLKEFLDEFGEPSKKDDIRLIILYQQALREYIEHRRRGEVSCTEEFISAYGDFRNN